ncbi:MAG: hypothetical protein L6V93_06055 [Clostridiales bacterium]|nr:MAG: hypothetical protein L6V93_06055 [Clostridiales bacterium]
MRALLKNTEPRILQAQASLTKIFDKAVGTVIMMTSAKKLRTRKKICRNA